MFGESECPCAASHQMKMKVKYKCNGGGQDNTKVRKRNDPECNCPTAHGKMKSADIPLEGGWINIVCSVRADCNSPKPCIFIHKVRAGCSGGAPIAEHMTLVSYGIYLS